MSNLSIPLKIELASETIIVALQVRAGPTPILDDVFSLLFKIVFLLACHYGQMIFRQVSRDRSQAATPLHVEDLVEGFLNPDIASNDTQADLISDVSVNCFSLPHIRAKPPNVVEP